MQDGKLRGQGGHGVQECYDGLIGLECQGGQGGQGGHQEHVWHEEHAGHGMRGEKAASGVGQDGGQRRE